MKNRPVIEVACGVLVNADGAVLAAQRPEGKIAAGKWEFPGGKIEAGESPLAALGRELHEELGIEVIDAEPLIRFRHDYTDRSVNLNTWKVTGWRGELVARERQRFTWLVPEQVSTLDVLPTVAPIARLLQLPAHYVFTLPDATVETVLAGLPALPRQSLLRLRFPGLAEDRYAAAARLLIPAAKGLGMKVLLDRSPMMIAALGADGWHADGRALAQLREPPLAAGRLLAASVHDEAQLAAALALGADLAVLGPVLPTSSHPGSASLGWTGFRNIRGTAPIAVFALGGLASKDLAEARVHGAQGVAGISAYWRERPLPAAQGSG